MASSASTSTRQIDFLPPVGWENLFTGTGKEAAPSGILVKNVSQWVIDTRNFMVQAEDDIRRLVKIHSQFPAITTSALPPIQAQYEALAQAVMQVYDKIDAGTPFTDDVVETSYMRVGQLR